MHPSQMLGAYNVDDDIRVGLSSVSIGKEQYDIHQCTIVPKGKDGTFIVNASVVSDMLATSFRFQEKEGIVSSIAKPEERSLMNVPEMKAVNVLENMGVEENNPSQASLCYFDLFLSKPKIAVPLMSDILGTLPDEFSCVSPKMTEFFVKAKKPYYRDEIRIPVISTPTVTFFEKMDLCYRFLERCRAFRGDDGSGIGALSIGYPLFKMPRHYMKSWAFCQDMRMLCNQMGNDLRINFIEAPGTMHLNVLVANGFMIGVSISARRFDKAKPLPGLYSSVPDAIVVRNIGSKPPTVTKLGVNYIAKEDFENLVDTLVPGQVIPIHMNPYMEEKLSVSKGLGYMPSAMAHNGIVYMGIFKSIFKMSQLIKRFSRANSFRNTFVYRRVPWLLADPMKNFYMEDVIFPKTRDRAKKDELYESVVVDETLAPLKDMRALMLEIEAIPDDVATNTALPLWTAIFKSSDDELYLFEKDILDNIIHYYDHEQYKFCSRFTESLVGFYGNMSELLAVHNSYPRLRICYESIVQSRTMEKLARMEKRDLDLETTPLDAQAVMLRVAPDDDKVESSGGEDSESDDELFDLLDNAKKDIPVKVSLKEKD